MSNNFYTYVGVLGNSILFKGFRDGEAITEKIQYSPTLYIPSAKGDWKSLYDNKSLAPVTQGSIKDAKDFIDKYEGVNDFEVHGMTKWQYQYIHDNYPSDIDYDLNLVNILTFDIEVITEDGSFPDIETAPAPIVMISFYSTIDKITYVYGIKEFTGNSDGFVYKRFPDEKTMLVAFIQYIKSTKPDVWTGWNIDEFDVPYLINRIVLLLGDKAAKILSPFGYIREKKLTISGRQVQTYEVYGLTAIDYMVLYKKFVGARNPKESYALGFIAQEELGHTKVDMPGDSFKDNYNNHFNTFVEYSAVDTSLVEKLDKKLELIPLSFAMAYMFHCNLPDIYKTTAPWEAYIYHYLCTKNIAVPKHKNGMSGEVEGAWVKEGKKAMYGWVMSFDFKGLYAHIMWQWNISPETFIPPVHECRAKDFLDMNDKALAAIEHAKNSNCSLGGNGAMFDKSRTGFLSELMELCVTGRKVAKDEQLRLEGLYEKTKDKSLLPRISALTNKQTALKLAGNSVYGALGNEYFLYYDYRIAEAVTLSGQLSDIHLSGKLNDKLNTILKTKGIDYVIYGDTDSIYLDCNAIVETFVKDKSRERIVDFLDKFGTQVCQPIIDASVSEIFDRMNCKIKVMGSKREVIASKMLFRAKKNYALYVHNSEGVAYDPPKLKVLGIEIVRSSTPKWCRDRLKSALKSMFEKDELYVRDYYEKSITEFKKLTPEEISSPRGVSDIDKWTNSSGMYTKGVPIAVRGSILYNYHTKDMGKYPRLVNGDKVKFVYVKIPNYINENVIAFPASGKLPPELRLHEFIDYDLQFEKTFSEPLKSLTDIAGWKLEDVATLDEFF
jgi:DNA polymerase elongation subunit (family B)